MQFKKYRNDILLFISFILVGFLLYCLMNLGSWFQKTDAQKAVVTITCDSETIGQYSLECTADIPISTTYGTNLVHIENGSVSVTAADCPDRYCVNHAPITDSREPIVCLPHKLVVKIQISSREESEVPIDGITK